MSFRETCAWITLVSVLVSFGVYFGAIVTGVVSPRGEDTVALLVACVVALIVLHIGLMIVAATLKPNDARAPKDERERQILSRSHTFGYYTLATLVLALGIPVHIGHGSRDLLNFALLGVVLAELVVVLAQIIMFRRGA